MNKLKFLLDDFERAIVQLSTALERTEKDELIQAGCIKYFEFTFELAWKTLKSALVDQGLPDCYSPKSCFKQAFTIGWIEDEEIWLEMLEARNRMSHIYNSQTALDIYKHLPKFLGAFKTLSKKLKEI